MTGVGYTLDYDELEELGKKRANKFFDLYFKAAKKYPKKAEKIRRDFIKDKITYEEAIKKLRELKIRKTKRQTYTTERSKSTNEKGE